MEDKRSARCVSKMDIKRMDEQLDRLFMKKMNNAVTAKNDDELGIFHPDKLVLKRERAFASGAFGSVYQGVYDGEEVAVKVVNWGGEEISEAQADSLKRDFKQEVSVWKNIEHPNVTKFIGATTNLKFESKEAKRTCIYSGCVVSEYLPGGTLKSYLIKNRKKKLPLETVKQLALDIARGLSYLHSKKIVHRDLKTENLLLDKQGRVKIADFGVARLEALDASEMTGSTGTPGYMAPEVLENKPYNKKCDVYSFGICLWEIYRCDMPDRDLSFEELTSKPNIPKHCPSSLAQVMKRCWDADPRNRPEMEEVVSLIEAIDTRKNKFSLSCFCFPKL